MLLDCTQTIIVIHQMSVHCCCSIAKLCPTLCDPMDCSTPDSSVLHCLPEWRHAHNHVHWMNQWCYPTISSSVSPTSLQPIPLPPCELGPTRILTVGFSWQEYQRGLEFPPSGDLPDPGIEPVPLAWTGRCFTTEPPWKPLHQSTRATIAKYHGLCGIKQQNFIFSPLWRPEVQDQGIRRAGFSWGLCPWLTDSLLNPHVVFLWSLLCVWASLVFHCMSPFPPLLRTPFRLDQGPKNLVSS